MKVLEKVKWTLGVILVFVVILMTNLIDRHNFLQVKSSITSIYEDRLVAKNLIVEMLKLTHQQELQLLADSATDAESFSLNDYQNIITQYESTKLTREERLLFDELKANLEVNANAHEKYALNTSEKRALLASIANIKQNLYQLSEIQISEGKNQMLISQRAIDTVELFTEIEIYVLIVLALLVQVIVMYKPK